MRHIQVISDDAWQALAPPEKDILTLWLSDPLMQKFMLAQSVAAGAEATKINPMEYPDEKALEFLKAAKDMRLIQQFWLDLQGFSDNLATVRARQQRTGV